MRREGQVARQSEETLTVAIMCSLAGTIHVFKLPTSVEMWHQIRALQKDAHNQLGKSWLWKKIDPYASSPFYTKSIVRIHLLEIEVPADQARATINSEFKG